MKVTKTLAIQIGCLLCFLVGCATQNPRPLPETQQDTEVLAQQPEEGTPELEVPEEKPNSEPGTAAPDIDVVINTEPTPVPQETGETDEPEQPSEERDSSLPIAEAEDLIANREAVFDLCERIGNKLGSVAPADCHNQPLVHSGHSTNGLSLAYRNYEPVEGREPLGRVLVLGGIHGDEFSSVSVLFKWLKILDQHHSGLFDWRFVPLVNPDGLLQRKSQRQNSNGVDLNRNFPTKDWNKHAQDYWINETYRNARRYPGPAAASELETQWVIEQINSFKPDVVIAKHAPYHLVDYDGPPKAPENLGSLYLRKLGVYPGSLGNYVGIDMGKPIVTVELKSAGIMPSPGEIESMWGDLVQWLRNQLNN